MKRRSRRSWPFTLPGARVISRWKRTNSNVSHGPGIRAALIRRHLLQLLRQSRNRGALLEELPGVVSEERLLVPELERSQGVQEQAPVLARWRVEPSAGSEADRATNETGERRTRRCNVSSLKTRKDEMLITGPSLRAWKAVDTRSGKSAAKSEEYREVFMRRVTLL